MREQIQCKIFRWIRWFHHLLFQLLNDILFHSNCLRGMTIQQIHLLTQSHFSCECHMLLIESFFHCSLSLLLYNSCLLLCLKDLLYVLMKLELLLLQMLSLWLSHLQVTALIMMNALTTLTQLNMNLTKSLLHSTCETRLHHIAIKEFNEICKFAMMSSAEFSEMFWHIEIMIIKVKWVADYLSFRMKLVKKKNSVTILESAQEYFKSSVISDD